MKTWLSQRISFMEQQFVDPPESDRPAGYTQPGTLVSLKSKEGGKIYYTLDGTDPRRAGGTVAAKAILYAGRSIQINESTLLTARVYKTSHRGLTGSNNPPLSSKWSGPLTQFYSIAPSPVAGDLLISELHYHPADPTPDELSVDATFKASDFEFIELLNNSEQTLNLTSLALSGEVRFSFLTDADKILNRGERLLLVRNTRAFATRYGAEIPTGGVYSGKLGNGGGRLEIVDQAGRTILELSYLDDWHPTTDGQGFSLVAKRAVTPGAEAGAEYWRASWETHGSPGASDERASISFTTIEITAEGVELSFPLPGGRGAVVQYTDALGQTEWLPLKTIEAAAEAQAAQVTDETRPSTANRFYRLLLKPGE
jgi:hypothetical protein